MYTPPFTISAEAINMIAEISGLIERYAIRLEQEDALRLRKANRIRTIHSSLAIEGNRLTEDDVCDIINGKHIVAPIKEIQEVKNAIKTYEMYPRLDAFKEEDLLKAHAQMMEAIIDHPGGYRRGGVGVFSEHPLFEHLPVENMVFSNQQAYYDAITASSQAADSGVFIDFMLSEILATLKDHQGEELREVHDRVHDRVHDKVHDKHPGVSDSAWNVLNYLGDNDGASAKKAAEALGMSERMIRKHIATLKSAGLLSRVGGNKYGKWIAGRSGMREPHGEKSGH